ncbi:MAG: DUF6036 family nucleotidyltransferase [Thermoproteus sp.]
MDLAKSPDISVAADFGLVLATFPIGADRCREAGGLLIPSPEDLAVLKLASGERKDIEDLKKLLRLPLDLSYLRRRALQAGLEKELERIWRRVHGTRL